MAMTRLEARELLEQHVQAVNLRNHCRATEVIMRALAERLGRDLELWGLVGLLHDLDFETTRDDPAAHALKTVELLAPHGFPREALNAILRHNAEALRLERESELDYALTCAETVTGLIVAAALVHPDKCLKSLTPKSVLKRMKSKDFARNVNRAHVVLCENLGVPLVDFVTLSLQAMTSIAPELGLCP
jgi:uncharacterized protein